jgi:hypothetical protein
MAGAIRKVDDFEIESGVPPPARQNIKVTYPFTAVKKGECLKIPYGVRDPDKFRIHVLNAIRRDRRAGELEGRFTVRVDLKDKVVRVWKVT